MIDQGRYYDGDENIPQDWYFSADEAIQYLGISRGLFYQSVLPLLTPYILPTFRRWKFYRRTELDRYKGLRP